MAAHSPCRPCDVCAAPPLPMVAEIARRMGFDSNNALAYRAAALEAALQQSAAELSRIDARLTALAGPGGLPPAKRRRCR